MEERRVVIVTGAGGYGVGRGVCDALTESGVQLVLTDVDESGLADAIGRHPGASGFPGDLRDPALSRRLIEFAIEEFGHVDGLVNNAGIGLDRPIHRTTEADFDRLHDVNLRAVWNLSRAFASHRIDAGQPGVIVNVSSVHASATQPGYSLYASTKGAVEALTRALAVELGTLGIRCNAVAPGAVLDETFADRYGLDEPDPLAWIRSHAARHQAITRPIAPIDVGRVVSFLISPESWAIAGQTIAVDAGMSSLLYDRAVIQVLDTY